MTNEIHKQRTTKKANDNNEITIHLTHLEALEIAHFILFSRNKHDSIPLILRDKVYRQIMTQIKQE